MAILQGFEGNAHVESKGNLSTWGGYIFLDPDITDLFYFDIAGPKARGVYEGPVVIDGKYYFVNGDVLVRKIEPTQSEIRIEFVGVGKINIVRPLPIIPDDYLP